MKLKKIFSVMLTALILLSLAACNNAANNNEENKRPDRMNKIISYLKEEGFKVNNKQIRVPDKLGAESGFSVDVNGKHVEFYRYDMDSDIPQEFKTIIDEILETGILKTDKTEGSAMFNGDILMAGYDNITNKKLQTKLIEAFKAFPGAEQWPEMQSAAKNEASDPANTAVPDDAKSDTTTNPEN